MEYEKDANFSNFTFDEDVTPASSMVFIAHEIIFTIFTILGLCADVAIVYVIFRFRRMKKPENIYLANWAISDFASLLVAPSGFRIISILDNFNISSEFMCSLFHVGETFQTTTMLFVLFVSIDWFIAAHFEKTSAKFRNYQKYYIGTIWIFNIIICFVSTGYCINDVYSFISVMIFVPLFFILSLSIIVMQCSRAVRKCCLKRPVEHSPFYLNLATAFPLSYFLAFIFLVIFNITRAHPLIGMIVEILIFCNAIINIILLYNFDKDFQSCFLQVLRRSKYEESDFSFDNPIITRVYDNCSIPIQMSFKDNSVLLSHEIY